MERTSELTDTPPRDLRATAHPPRAALTTAIRREVTETPYLSLSLRQAMQRWSLDETSCRDALGDLVEEHFLYLDGEGRYRNLAW